MPRRVLEPIRPGRNLNVQDLAESVNRIIRVLNRDANAIDRRALYQRRRQRLMNSE